MCPHATYDLPHRHWCRSKAGLWTWEKALNHIIGDVRGVYNQMEYAEQRRETLQAWAAHIDGVAQSANLLV